MVSNISYVILLIQTTVILAAVYFMGVHIGERRAEARNRESDKSNPPSSSSQS